MRVILALYVAAALLFGSTAAIKLKFRLEECMTYDMEQYNPVYGSFISMPDVYRHVASYDLVVTSPTNAKVHEDFSKTESKFHFVPYEAGRYRFCIKLSGGHGQPSHALAKEVVWDFHTSYYHAEEHGKAHLKEQDTQDLWHYINQVDSQIQQLRSTQQYLYWRERRHRETVDSTNSRVWWGAVARCFGLISVSIVQVLFIRRLFYK